MGRPPTGKVAMTDAERMQRYRARLRNDSRVTKQSKPGASKAAALEARIKELEAEVAALKAAADKARKAAMTKALSEGLAGDACIMAAMAAATPVNDAGDESASKEAADTIPSRTAQPPKAEATDHVAKLRSRLAVVNRHIAKHLQSRR